MPSGGARRNAGRSPDPDALRRDRKDDASWVTLPVEGFQGDVPDWPLSYASEFEIGLWEKLWRKPQAVMWHKLGLELQLAAYARAFYESTSRDAVSGLKTAVLRMEGELGLSLPGMHSLRWKFSEDELSVKRSEPVKKSASSAKSRLAAVSGS